MFSKKIMCMCSLKLRPLFCAFSPPCCIRVPISWRSCKWIVLWIALSEEVEHVGVDDLLLLTFIHHVFICSKYAIALD